MRFELFFSYFLNIIPITKISPYVNLSNGLLSLSLNRNLFLFGYNEFKFGFYLLIVYTLFIDALIFLFSYRSKKTTTKARNFV